MRRLSQRIERQKSVGEFPCLRQLARRVSLQHGLGAVQEPAAKALALDEKPFLERRIANIQTLEQVTTIEGGRRGNSVQRSLSDETLEFPHVGGDRRIIERERRTIGQDRQRNCRPETRSESAERLLQAVPCLLLGPVTPQQSAQHVA